MAQRDRSRDQVPTSRSTGQGTTWKIKGVAGEPLVVHHCFPVCGQDRVDARTQVQTDTVQEEHVLLKLTRNTRNTRIKRLR
jgi:hypothetical protein